MARGHGIKGHGGQDLLNLLVVVKGIIRRIFVFLILDADILIRTKNDLYDAQKNGKPKCRPKPLDFKRGHDRTCHYQNQGIYYEDKKSESEKGGRDSEKNQKRFHKAIQNHDDCCRYKSSKA